MRTTVILATLAAVIASPALAQTNRHHQAQVPQWNEPATAYDQATNPTNRAQAYYPNHIIVNGRDQGTDPDPRVRLQLQRDPPYGGGL